MSYNNKNKADFLLCRAALKQTDVVSVSIICSLTEFKINEEKCYSKDAVENGPVRRGQCFVGDTVAPQGLRAMLDVARG